MQSWRLRVFVSCCVFAVGCSQPGAQWLPVQSPPTSQALNAVHGSSSSDLYVAGNSGLLMHFDGSAWRTLATNTVANLEDVLVVSETEVWVVGEGTLLTGNHRDGFKKLVTATDETFKKIWRHTRSELILAGIVENYVLQDAKWVKLREEDGTTTPTSLIGGAFDFAPHPKGGTWLVNYQGLFRVNGDLATREYLGVEKLFHLLVSEPSGALWIYSVEEPQNIIRYVDGKLNSVELGSSVPKLLEALISEEGEVWFVSAWGQVLVWDGAQIKVNESNAPLGDGSAGNLAFWGASPKDVWAVTSEGKIFRRYAP